MPTRWGALRQEVRELAAALRRLGLERGARVAVMGRTCRRWQVVELATLWAGGVVVGIDAEASPEQIEFILARCEASCLWVDTPERLAKVPAPCRGRLRLVALFEGSEPAGASPPAYRWEDLASPPPGEDAGPPGDGDRAPAGAAGTAPTPTPDAEDPATIIFTSGTTGTPKGIAYTHAQVLVACRSILDVLPDLDEEARVLCWLPMAHLFQRMVNFVAMSCGAAIYFVEDPREVMACVAAVQPTLLASVPRFYEKLHQAVLAELSAAGWKKHLAFWALDVGRARARRLERGQPIPQGLRLRHALADRLVLRRLRALLGGRMKYLITGSAPAAPWLLEFFHACGLCLLEAYGVSENTIPMAMNRPRAFRFGSVGLPLPGNEIRLAEDGEVLVRGPGVFRGYDHEPRPAERFTADGFYRTGDYGRFDEHGFLYLLGRKVEIIKTSTGRRISPAQVELAYLRSPCIEQLVVFGNGRGHLVGLVTLDPAAVRAALERSGRVPPAPEQLSGSPEVRWLVRRELEHYGASLAPYERLRDFAILPAPLSVEGGELTANLKLRRDRIEAKYQAEIERLYASPAAPDPGDAEAAASPARRAGAS